MLDHLDFSSICSSLILLNCKNVLSNLSLFQMLNEQDKLVEEIFSHEDKDKVTIL